MRIDLNADLGEGMPGEAALLGLITTANLAGGGHAGGGAVLTESVAASRMHGVAIGAHPSYPDRANFGRVSLLDDIDETELTDSLVQQITAVAQANGGALHHVKAHGALYNDAIVNERAARVLLAAVNQIDAGLPVMTMEHGALAAMARADGHPVITEVFADRAYHRDGTLVSRSQAGAVIDDAEVISARMLGFLEHSKLTSIDGDEVTISAESICIHGDNAHAVEIARHLYAALIRAGIEIAAV